MGVFYNPAQPMSLHELGYSSAPISGAMQHYPRQHDGPKNQDTAYLKYLDEKQKAAALNEAVKQGGGDIEKTSTLMSTIDPKYSNEWTAQRYDNQSKAAEAMKKQNQVLFDTYRQGAEMITAGDKALGMSLIQKVDPSVKDIQPGKVPGQYKVTHIDPDTNKPITNMVTHDDLIKGATDANTVYTQMQENYRSRAKLLNDNKNLSLDQIKAAVVNKAIIAEQYLAKANGDQNKAIQMAKADGKNIFFTPEEKTLDFDMKFGNLMAQAPAALALNTDIVKLWNTNKMGTTSPAEFISKLQAQGVNTLRNELSKSLFRPEYDTNVTPKGIEPVKTGSSTSASVSTETTKNPATASTATPETKPNYATNDKGFITGVRKLPDGSTKKTSVDPSNIDAAIQQGFTPDTK